MLTAEECQRRADEAKTLAARTLELWEREILLRIATPRRTLPDVREVPTAEVAATLEPTLSDPDVFSESSSRIAPASRVRMCSDG
jgi:hypothetical protein